MCWRIFHGAYFAGPLGREEKTQCLSCRHSGGKDLLCEDAHGPQAPARDKTQFYKRARPRPGGSRLVPDAGFPRPHWEAFRGNNSPREDSGEWRRVCSLFLPVSLSDGASLAVSLGPSLRDASAHYVHHLFLQIVLLGTWALSLPYLLSRVAFTYRDRVGWWQKTHSLPNWKCWLSGQPLAERLAPGRLVVFYLIKTPHLSQALPLPPLLVLQTWGSLQGRQPGCPSRRRQTERNASCFISSDCRWHWRGHIHPWAPGVYLGGRRGASHFKQEVWRRASPGPWAAHWSWRRFSVTTSLTGRDTEAWRRFLGGCSTLCLFVPQHLPIFGVKGGACIYSNFGWRARWDLAT